MTVAILGGTGIYNLPRIDVSEKKVSNEKKYQLVEYFINLMYSARASSGSRNLDETITEWETALYTDTEGNKAGANVTNPNAALGKINEYLKGMGSTNSPPPKSNVVNPDLVHIDIPGEEGNYSKIISLIRQELNTKTRYINDNEDESEKPKSDPVEDVIEKAMSIHSIEKFLETVPEICKLAKNVSTKLQEKHKGQESVNRVSESINKTVERTKKFHKFVSGAFLKWRRTSSRVGQSKVNTAAAAPRRTRRRRPRRCAWLCRRPRRGRRRRPRTAAPGPRR